MRNKKKLRTHKNAEMLEQHISVYAQLVLIYGVMTGVFVACSILAYATNPVSALHESERLLLNAYVPTTITFIGAAIFEYDFVKSNKMLSSGLLVLVVAMTLLYITYESVFTTTISKITNLISTLVVLCSAASIVLVVKFMRAYGVSPREKTRGTAEGHLSAIRRVTQ